MIDTMVTNRQSERESLPNALSLTDELEYVQLLILRQVQVFRKVTNLSPEFLSGGMAITDYQVNRLLNDLILPNETTQKQDGTELDTKIQQTKEHLSAKRLINAQKLTLSRLENIVSKFQLNEVEELVLMLAVATGLDERYGTLVSFLQDDATKRLPCLSLAFALLQTSSIEAWTDNSTDRIIRSLLEGRIVTFATLNNTDRPLVERELKIDDGVLAYITGRDGIDQKISEIATFYKHTTLTPNFVGEPDVKQAIEQIENLLEQACEVGFPVAIQIVGPEGVGKKTAARNLASRSESPLLVVDVDQLIGSADLESKLCCIRRETFINGALVFWDKAEILIGDSTALRREREAIVAFIVNSEFPMLVGTTQRWEPYNRESDFRLITIEIPQPGYSERLELWELALENTAPSFERSELATLAGSFQLNGKQIIQAVNRAVSKSKLGQRSCPSHGDLLESASQSSSTQLESLAKKVRGSPEWGKLVLPAEQKSILRDICNRFKHQHVVYGDWDFASISGNRTGLNVLFSGPSGTGKTMSASIIANELGLEMYRIDLSSVVSKFIGETEKNLEQVFQAAEGSNAILLFDEADSIFGKRSEVKDAHDRYANLEVSYLLQKMEDYAGIAILTTNFKKNLDEAFLRRIDFSLEFPLPNEPDRLSIWKQHIPSQTPLSDDIDFDFLARQFNISGGNIRNIILSAAFYAASSSTSIHMEHFIKGVKHEFLKLGRLITVEDFGPYIETQRYV